MNKHIKGCVAVFGTTVLTACASGGADLRLDSLEGKITELNRRVEALEDAQQTASQPVPALTSCQQQSILRDQLRTLQNKRAALSTKYTEKHPAIRDLDRQMLRIARQSALLDTPTTPCNGTDPPNQREMNR